MLLGSGTAVGWNARLTGLGPVLMTVPTPPLQIGVSSSANRCHFLKLQ
jgi:hypothetical protein